MDYIININIRVRNQIKKHGTRDPEAIALANGIAILRRSFKGTKGFFKIENKRKFIVVNSNLSEWQQKIIIAHELGHALLHCSKEEDYIHHYSLVPRNKAELEAHKFAAELIINEKELDKDSFHEMTIDQLSCFYGVSTQMIEYKFFWKSNGRSMIQRT